MSDSEEVKQLIRHHGVPGTVRVWRSREYGYFGRWHGVFIRLGQLDDGRWYVQIDEHDITGPWRAAIYSSETDAHAAATGVMAKAEPALKKVGYVAFNEFD